MRPTHALAVTVLAVSAAPDARSENSPAAVAAVSTSVSPSRPVPQFVEPPVTLPAVAASNLGGKNPLLNPQELAGVGITQTWIANAQQAMLPEPGPDGAIRFRYGESEPVIVCAPFEITDIELEPGESVADIQKDVHLADMKRWSIESSVETDTGVQHLFVQTQDSDLQTTVAITTNRRTYRLALLSHGTDFMAHVAFVYPGRAPVVAAAAAAAAKDPPASEPSPKVPKVQVSFAAPNPPKLHRSSDGKRVTDRETTDAASAVSYRVTGKAAWRPVSVYAENGHTYIEMPRSILTHDTPVLFVLRKSGLFGLGNQKTVTNYAVKGRWYIVDEEFDRAELVIGTGSSAQRCVITRVGGQF